MNTTEELTLRGVITSIDAQQQRIDIDTMSKLKEYQESLERLMKRMIEGVIQGGEIQRRDWEEPIIREAGAIVTCRASLLAVGVKAETLDLFEQYCGYRSSDKSTDLQEKFAVLNATYIKNGLGR